MRTLRVLWQEAVGLFVDDGALAVSILLWVAAIALVLPRLGVPAGWRAVALFAGLAASLVASCLRHTRTDH